MTVLLPAPQHLVDAEFERIVDELTRRGFLGGALGSAALLGLAACGSSGDGSGPSHPATRSTRVLDGAYGPVEVPVAPKRVVALSKAAVATLLDVGLTPVGVDDDEAPIQLPRYQSAVAALPTVGSYGEFDVEKIATLEPDLVISFDTYLDDKLYPKLSSIVPTFALKTDEGQIGWQQASAAFAHAVGRDDPLAALRGQYTAALANVTEKYADVLRKHTWEITQAAEAGTFYRYLPTSDPSVILTKLGATLGNAGAKGPNYWGKELSYEVLGQQLGAADVILCVKVGSGPLLTQQAWRDLPAARAGHVYTTDLLFPASYTGAIALVDYIAGVCADLQGGSR